MNTTFNLLKLIRPNVAAMTAYSSARDEFHGDDDDETVFLDANENPYDNGLNRYPDPHQRVLKKKFADLKHVKPNQILLGNGSDEVLDLIFRAFCEPNADNVISLTPTYGMYEVLANLNAVENRTVQLSASFKPDVDAILEAIDAQTKLIFICAPNNPTGNTFSEKKVARLLTEFKGLVVIDEAYIDFSDKKSWLVRLEEFPNLIITQTMSKAYGLAAIRLGICYASPAIIDVLKKIKPPYNVNELTQQRALKRLQNNNKVKKQIKYINKNKEYLINELQEFRFVKEIYPSDANFILIKCDDAQKRYNQLKQNGVISRYRGNLKGCENCLRITVGNLEEIKEIVRIFKKGM